MSQTAALLPLPLWRYSQLNHVLLRYVVGSSINAWRVNGHGIHMPFTSCPDYGETTPTTVISMLSDWTELHPYHNTGHMELVSFFPTKYT